MDGRLAPSPTGAQHLGNARTFLIAWLLCRRAKSRLWLRIEDLETPRVKAWAIQQAIDDLQWLGLDWDRWLEAETPIIQSQRLEHYQRILNQLTDADLVYPCTCTRSQIEAVAAAPHETLLDGVIYPGTCSSNSKADASEFERNGVPFAWRFRMPSGPQTFEDRFLGRQNITCGRQQLGDFIVSRSNGMIAYQLAVVVDDYEMSVQEVVRGDDLVASTFRQLALYEALHWSPPQFCHLPLVVGLDGKRLAKRHGDTRLAHYRESNISSEAIVGFLAHRSGWIEQTSPISPQALLDIDPLANLSRQPLMVADEELFKFAADCDRHH